MLVPSLSFVLLFVKNPTESAEFYTQIFKLDPVESSPTFALFVLANGVKLGLWSSKTAEPAVHILGGGSEICFECEDVDSLYRDWVQCGIPMAQVPTDMDFGRTFVALDPDGHRIRVMRLFEE